MNSTTLSSFSPLAAVFLKPLALEDKNNNGTIDKGAGEGYEQFITKYGNSDNGYKTQFGLLQGATDGRLDEKEIVDYYYLNIRYIFPQETKFIEADLATEIRRAGLYSAWLDDGTVKSLLEQVSPGLLSPARDLPSALAELRLALAKTAPYWRTDDLSSFSYYTLPEAVRTKQFTCYEATLLAFWFTSELQVRSIPAFVSLTGATLHQFLYIPDKAQAIDLTGTLESRQVDIQDLRYENPIQLLGQYYSSIANLQENAGTTRETAYLEKALQYQKNNDDIVLALMYCYIYPKDKTTRDFSRAAELGQHLLTHIDFEKVISGDIKLPAYLKKNIVALLCYLIHCYRVLKNRDQYNAIVTLANRYFPKDMDIQDYLETFKPWY